MTDYAVLVAGAAGSVEADQLGPVLGELATGGSVRLVWMTSGDDLASALDRLDDRVPVVAGGDGTLHRVVAALTERGELADRPVGLVPMGTGNDLARATGVPTDPIAAARAVVSGNSRVLPIAVGSLGVVCNAAHAGVGAAAAEAADAFKRRLGRIGYPMGSVRSGLSAGAVHATAVVDGAVVWDRPTLLVAVGVGTTVGGGRPLFPSSDPGGLIEVVLVEERGALGRIRLAADVRRGRHAATRRVTTLRGERLEVRSRFRRWDVDGELVDAPPVVDLRLRRDAWRLLGASD